MPGLNRIETTNDRAAHGKCRVKNGLLGITVLVGKGKEVTKWYIPVTRQGSTAVELTELDTGAFYFVHGNVCTCPDYTRRGRQCKHVRAVAAVKSKGINL